MLAETVLADEVGMIHTVFVNYADFYVWVGVWQVVLLIYFVVFGSNLHFIFACVVIEVRRVFIDCKRLRKTAVQISLRR